MNSYACISCDIEVTNPEGDTVRFRSCVAVEIDTSYDTVTDTAKVTLPRDQRWIIPDDNGLNTYVLMDADGLQTAGLLQRGDQIEIKLGYDFDDKVVFTGYITGIDAKRPFTLHCEDAAWLLKQKTLSYSAPGNTNLSDLIVRLLEDTGIQLHLDAFTDIDLGKVSIRNATPAQVLNDLRKKGIISFIKDGELMTGYGSLNGNSIVRSSATDGYAPPNFNFEYDIPADGNDLKVKSLDKRSVLVKAQSILSNNKRINMEVVLDPVIKDNQLMIISYSDGSSLLSESEQFEVVEEATLQNVVVNREKIDNINQYQARTLTLQGVTDLNQLFEQAKAFWFQIVDTGLEGSFTAFGDFNLKPTETVNLIDPSNPEIEGEFIIKSVKKTWGQRGFRQVVQVPHKFKNFDQ